MTLSHSPNIVRDGLVFSLDPANKKSLPYQNLLLNSEDIHLSPWSSSNSATRTQASITGPLGYGFATRVLTSTTSPSLISQTLQTSSIGVGQQYCSVYAKQDTASTFTFNCYYVDDTEININFNLSNGTTSSPSNSFIENVGNGWYRCTIIIPARVGTGTSFAWRIWPEPRSAATGIGCLFWGAQIRRPYAPSTYIKTESSIIDFGNTIKDISNNGNNGTLVNFPTFSSSNQGSLVFDGVDDFIGPISTIQDSFWNSDSWSASFWVNFLNVATGVDNTLITHGVQTANNGLHLVERSGRLYFGLWSNDITGTSILSPNTWYNATYTFNFTTKLKKIYLNGNLDNSGGTVGYSGTGSNTRIGTSVGLLRFLRGNLSNVSLWSKELNENEIKQNFNALRGRYGI